jgi:two-component system phosphate regulon sensor histidine kinase PhoR
MSSLIIAFVSLLLGAALMHWRQRARLSDKESGHVQELQRLKTSNQHLLAQQTSRTAALFDAMVEGVLVLDANRRVVMANTAMRELFNVGNEAIGHPLIDALRLHAVHDIVQRTLGEGQAIDEEIEVTRIDSANRQFQVNSALIGGDSQGMVLVFNDITRLKQLEETRREFIANVSHELRTPLSVIKGCAETLTLPGGVDVPKFASMIERHADRLTLLVEDLLTLSSIESGYVTMNVKPVNLSALVRQVVESLAPKASERDVAVHNDVDEGCNVHGDAVRLHQVLTNLIENAIKYGHEHGDVMVGSVRTATAIILSVSDDGPGIPGDARERVFERFYRLDKARSREQGGTGLGLAIVKHIVQAHGGRVWVETSEGGGAKFCLTLPVSSANEDAKG